MIASEGITGGDGGNEKENVDPVFPKKATRGKRKSGQASREGSKVVKKRRTVSPLRATHDYDGPENIPKSPNPGDVNRKMFSERKPDRNIANTPQFATSRETRATAKANAEIRTEHRQQDVLDEKQNLKPGHRPAQFRVPETPKRRRDVVPSSQSPESISNSSKNKLLQPHYGYHFSPTNKRSINVTPTRATRFDCAARFTPTSNGLSPKRKICVLKYRQSRFRKSTLQNPDPKDGGVTASSILPSPQHPRRLDEHNRIGIAEFKVDDCSLESFQPTFDSEIPESSAAVPPEVIPSSHTEPEEEDEIPETSQGLRRVASASSANRSEMNLQVLPTTSSSPLAAGKTGNREDSGQLEADLRDADIHVHDFVSRHGDVAMGSDNVESVERQAVAHVQTPSRKLSARLPQKKSTVSTISDSQGEDDDVDRIQFNLESSKDQGTPLYKQFTRRAPLSPNPRAQSQLPGPAITNSQTFPPPPHSSNPTATATTLIPTKFTPSSYPSSSPTIPASPPPRLSTTQRSIHPASMPHPSQVSTQGPTQPPWFPMSSMPFANIGLPLSSPRTHNRASELKEEDDHITIKDSSSLPAVALRDIPSQVQSQEGPDGAEFAIVDLGLGEEGIDDDGFSDRDEDLDPKSSQLPQADFLMRDRTINAADEDVVRNERVRDSYPASPANEAEPTTTITRTSTRPHPHHRHRSHSKTDTVHQQPQPQHHQHQHQHQHHRSPPPVARLQLSESMLESLPGPPGWVAPPQSPMGGSEKSWDGYML